MRDHEHAAEREHGAVWRRRGHLAQHRAVFGKERLGSTWIKSREHGPQPGAAVLRVSMSRDMMLAMTIPPTTWGLTRHTAQRLGAAHD